MGYKNTAMEYSFMFHRVLHLAQYYMYFFTKNILIPENSTLATFADDKAILFKNRDLVQATHLTYKIIAVIYSLYVTYDYLNCNA